MLDSFFNPKNIAVVGVSEEPTKLGSVVLNNLIGGGYKGELFAVNPKFTGKKLYGKPCFSSVKDIKESLDLVIIVVVAKFTSGVVDDCITNKTKNISIITAGFAEVGNKELEKEIVGKCRAHNINLLGPNCLGHISPYTNLDASFADGFPKKGNVAFISQSGAYCSAMLDWTNDRNIGFSHFISIGNKGHLSENELLKYLKDDPNTKAFIFYLESLKNGQEFLKIAREVTKTKPIVILEPGKSKKAQAASLSHTGSLAPNYRVLESAYENAGIIQVYNSKEMFGLLEILQFAKHMDVGGEIGVITNAGGMGVVTSDLFEENGLELGKPKEDTIKKLKSILPEEAALNNPIDIIANAPPEKYEATIRILCESKQYKNIIVLCIPRLPSDSLEIGDKIKKCNQEYKDINIWSVFVGGKKVNASLEFFNENNLLFYRYPTEVCRLLGILKKQMKFRNKVIPETPRKAIPNELQAEIEKAVNDRLASLPQSVVNSIMDYFKIDYPKSENFTNKEEALRFCQSIFPSSVVLKLSSPDALHKTEMKGIYINIDNDKKFDEAWDSLWGSIDKYNLRKASILVQEMIVKGTEAIIGVNYDATFGNVMIFGTGGIYTEVMNDTSIRVLPTNEFDQMVKETKIGAILNGVRGESPKALLPLYHTMSGIQDIIFSIPQVKSIDINPIIITEERAVVVDFKMILKN